MCLTAKNFGLQEANINISKPQGKTTNYENGIDRVPQKETERKKEGGRSALYEKGGYQIDLENIETTCTCERCCHLT